MSSSQHPIALSLERRIGGSTRLLATVMCLPLVDGVFAALVLAGALDGALGVAEVGLLIFGGSATVAVIVADMDGTRRERVRAVLGVGVVVVAVAAIEAAIAPTIQSVLHMAVFERFAGLVILAVAAKTASARVGEWLPRPALIVALGLVASVVPGGASLSLTTDPSLVARGTAAAALGVAFALVVALLAPWLRAAIDIDRFRFGSAVALGVLPLSIFGVIPGDAPLALAVLGVTTFLAFEPDRMADEVVASGRDVIADGGNDGASGGASDSSVADPADADSATIAADDRDEDDDSVSERVSNYVGTDTEREPWL